MDFVMIYPFAAWAFDNKSRAKHYRGAPGSFINKAGGFASTQVFAQEINEPQRGSTLYTKEIPFILLILEL